MHNRTNISAAGAVIISAVLLIIGSMSGAKATQGQPVLAGATNSSTDTTGIYDSSTTDHPGFEAKKSGTDLGAFGLHALGPNGISGDASTPGGIGVKGYGQPGVLGFGFLNSDGVDGQVNNACCSAVYGQNSGAGNGVAGRADSGTGVLAASDNGIALKVDGKTQMSRSGVATIAYPAKTAVVSGVPITAKTLAFATIQKFLAGTYVVAAVPNTSGSSNSFTIYLNKAPGSSTTPKSVVVAWSLVERP